MQKKGETQKRPPSDFLQPIFAKLLVEEGILALTRFVEGKSKQGAIFVALVNILQKQGCLIQLKMLYLTRSTT